MLQPNKSSFRLTDSDLTVIFHQPGKLAVFIGVFVTVIFCTVILIKIDMNARAGSFKIVSSQFNEGKVESQLDMTANYEKNVKDILNQYLVARTDTTFSTACQSIVNQTLEDVLNLVVPATLKEFHLKLVVLLDKESQTCIVDSGQLLDDEWDSFLNSYKWLRN